MRKTLTTFACLLCLASISACKRETVGNQFKGLPVSVSPSGGPSPRLYGMNPRQIGQELGAESRCDFREGRKILLVSSATGAIAVVDRGLRRMAAEDILMDGQTRGIRFYDGGVEIRIEPWTFTTLRHGTATSQQAALSFREGRQEPLTTSGIWSCGS